MYVNNVVLYIYEIENKKCRVPIIKKLKYNIYVGFSFFISLTCGKKVESGWKITCFINLNKH